MKDFLSVKLERDFFSNKNLCLLLEEHEDLLSDFILRSMSHIINVHHSWNARLRGVEPESSAWDVLPLDYFVKFNLFNYNESIAILDDSESQQKVNYHDAEGVQISIEQQDVFYQILQHSTHHRAQIAMELRRLKLPVPLVDFVIYN